MTALVWTAIVVAVFIYRRRRDRMPMTLDLTNPAVRRALDDNRRKRHH